MILTVGYVCMESVCMYGSKTLLLYFPILTEKYSNLFTFHKSTCT